eukprot:830-Heterococcus_DN1.PRE.4
MLPADAAKAVHSAAEATAEAFMAGARRANSAYVHMLAKCHAVSVQQCCSAVLSSCSAAYHMLSL